MTQDLRKVANVLAVLLLIALVVPFVIYAVPGTIGADESFVVLTASMSPAIEPGDVVVVADRDPATIQEGDVITFVRGTSDVPVTHRVVTVVDGMDGPAFETQGDANSDPDTSLVPAANVIGVVALTIPYIGYVIQFTNSPHGFLALVVVPFGLLVVNELWSLYRGRQADADQEPTADSGAEATTTAVGDAAGGLVITDRTLEGAAMALIPLAGYSAYVATTWPTAVTITVALATAGIAAAVVVGLVATRRQTEEWDDPDSEGSVTDGGHDEPEPPNAKVTARGDK